MKEAQFDTNELFFSITDKESKILSGNEVFVRISGYSKQELMGSLHNIIRHPDMPKVVFKILWDYLNADKPIVAYVKNRTKEGGYYWVLTAIFPQGERYVSIRIKPNSPIFAIVRELYFKLLIAESRGGMEESEPMLLNALEELGYLGYDQFMAKALLLELSERKKILDNIPVTDHNVELDSPLKIALNALLEDSQTLMRQYDHWFEKIDMFNHVKTMFEEKGVVLRHLARDIVFLSLNASVASYKVANGGETFGVLASDVRINAKENDILIADVETSVQQFSDLLNETIFSVSAIRLQIEMVTYFIREVLCQKSEVQLPELVDNISSLMALVIEYSETSKRLQLELDRQIQSALKYLDQLEQQMMYLGYIQVYGIIEAAGNQDESVRFGVIFSQLKTLVHETSQEIEIMQKSGHNFSVENRFLIKKSEGVDLLFRQLHEEILIIKELED